MADFTNSPLAPRTAGAIRIGLLCLAVMIVVNMAFVLWLNDGTFVYTLDDPYIHLALADHIRQGHYGVNAGEYSAPSSSILWPFLLAPVAGVLQAWLPLVLNIAFAALTVVAYGRFLGRVPHIDRLVPGRWGLASVVVLLILATNLLGLVFMGMEHALQVYLTALAVLGLVQVAEGRRPGWLVPVLVLGPLVRYENLAVSGPALAYLFYMGMRGPAVVGAVVLAALVGGFSVFLKHIGMAVLPTSILEKSAIAHGATGRSSAVLANLSNNLRTLRGFVLLGMALGLLGLVWRLRAVPGIRPVRALLGVGTVAIGLHLLIGRYGWYNRYEVYAIVFGLLLGFYGLAVWATTVAGGKNPLAAGRDRADGPGASPERWATGIGFAFAVLAAVPYMRGLPTLPLAANNIYQQQYQMHRFITASSPGRVAVNDLGLVSYHNPDYVLDLAGLASLESLKCGKGECGPGSAWMDRLARAHGVRLVMLYPEYFPGIPPSWRRIGRLTLGREKITPGRRHGEFLRARRRDPEKDERRCRGVPGEPTGRGAP